MNYPLSTKDGVWKVGWLDDGWMDRQMCRSTVVVDGLNQFDKGFKSEPLDPRQEEPGVSYS